MSTHVKWWLISDEVADEIRAALVIAHANLGSAVVQTYRDALHSLESGLHQTDAVPADYAEREGGAG